MKKFIKSKSKEKLKAFKLNWKLKYFIFKIKICSSKEKKIIGMINLFNSLKKYKQTLIKKIKKSNNFKNTTKKSKVNFKPKDKKLIKLSKWKEKYLKNNLHNLKIKIKIIKANYKALNN